MLQAGLALLFLAAALLGMSTAAKAETSLGINRIRYVEATGNEVQNCASLREVLSSISDSSSSNRYLVRLEPAGYDCGTTPVVVGEGIMIVGSGAIHTRIFGEVDSPTLGLVHFQGGRSGLRSVEVTNEEQDAVTTAIGISIWKVGGGSVGGVELRDIVADGDESALYIKNASVRVWTSQLFGTCQLEGSGGLTTFFHSWIADFAGSGSRSCVVSTDTFGVILENDCTLPP